MKFSLSLWLCLSQGDQGPPGEPGLPGERGKGEAGPKVSPLRTPLLLCGRRSAESSLLGGPWSSRTDRSARSTRRRWNPRTKGGIRHSFWVHVCYPSLTALLKPTGGHRAAGAQGS